MAAPANSSVRVTVDGKYFRLGEKKFHLKGVSYGPFEPRVGDGTFAPLSQTARDFVQIRELGANLIRVYHVPPSWFLELAGEYGLKVLVDIPCNKHLCFLDSDSEKEIARETVRQAVRGCAGIPPCSPSASPTKSRPTSCAGAA